MKIVTSYSGATMPMRDEQHVRNVRETLDGTWTYKGSKSGIRGEIDTEEDITEHADGKGWEVYPEEVRAADFDTDQDGMPNWYEQLVGSDPNIANQNDDPDSDGYTLLEDYLDFMAHPYLVIAPNGSGTLDLKPHFAGFYGQNGKTVTPTYTVDFLGNHFNASIDGSTLNVTANETGCIGFCEVTVDDGETTFTQRFGVAVTGDPAAIQRVWSEDDIDVARREFFTLDGQQVTEMQSQQVYLMRLTDTQGRVYTMKVIKN